MNKEVEEYESPYCEVCGTCGYIGCCGIRNFIEEHIKGKTNCKNEDLIISELINMCEYESDLQNRIDKAIKLIEEIQNFPHTNINQHKDLKELKEILRDKDEDRSKDN